jgi:hypothetical protein
MTMNRRNYAGWWQRAHASLAFLALLLGAPVVRAQSSTSAAAEALFDEGKKLMTAGKQMQACPKFEESQRLDPGSGTLINLALCYEQTGRTASAWSTYHDAASAAHASGNTERERGALARAQALLPKLSKLTIVVPDDARIPGLVVTRDGVEVGTAQWGVPIPSDEGTHEISAKASGYDDWHAKVAVSGAGTSASVTVPKLVVTPSVAPKAAPAAASTAATDENANAAQTATESKSGGLGTQRTLALVSGGVGVAGLVVGSVFGFKAMSNKNEADKTCNGSACTSPDGVQAGNDAHSAGTISTIGMVVGAAGVAGGLVLWFTAPSGSKAQVGISPTGVTLAGRF